MGLEPTRVTPISRPVHITQRQFNLSGTPLPEDMRHIITEHFGLSDTSTEELEIVYQYVLSKSPTGDVDDIKTTLQALADKLQPNKAELFTKIRELAVKEIQFKDADQNIDMKKDIIHKELPSLEKQASETGDWRFYLRASDTKEKLNETSNSLRNK